ncbi:MAG: cytochrome P450 [Deltaproteobacteria bacterium]|nr:cytochrome P450 [Deltaproteobacteria bacterium]
MNVDVAGGWLSAPVHTARLINDPLALMRGFARQHGPTFRLRLLDGDSLVTGDAAFIAEIFGGEEGLFDAPNEIVRPLVGDGSIVLANGARHKRKRKLMAPPFHGARMRSYGRTIADATERAMAPFAAGDVVDVLEVTQQISLEVILRAVFGVSDPARVEQLRNAIVDVVAGLPAWLLFMPVLHRRMGGVGPWARYDDAVAVLRALLLEEITRGRAAEPGSRDDVLALLLSARDEDGQPMGDDELVDELRTLVIAGHETTATTLAWALWELHRNPGALERVRAAVTSSSSSSAEPEVLARVPLLVAACDETLRMHPIVPIFRRRVTRAARLGGHDLAAGTLLSPAVLITHYDDAIYAEPDEFRPERFVDRKYGATEFMPFGGGNRRCLGAAFANYELQVALGTILRGQRFSTTSNEPLRLVMNGITTRSSGPIRLRVEARA